MTARPGGGFAAWYDVYCAHTDRHTARAEARAWYAAGITATVAATWARFGFTHTAARPHLAAGTAPAAAAAAEKGHHRAAD